MLWWRIKFRRWPTAPNQIGAVKEFFYSAYLAYEKTGLDNTIKSRFLF